MWSTRSAREYMGVRRESRESVGAHRVHRSTEEDAGEHGLYEVLRSTGVCAEYTGAALGTLLLPIIKE